MHHREIKVIKHLKRSYNNIGDLNGKAILLSSQTSIANPMFDRQRFENDHSQFMHLLLAPPTVYAKEARTAAMEKQFYIDGLASAM